MAKVLDELLADLAEAGYTLIDGPTRNPTPTEFRYSIAPSADKDGEGLIEVIFSCKGFVPGGFTGVIRRAGNDLRIDGNRIVVKIKLYLPLKN